MLLGIRIIISWIEKFFVVFEKLNLFSVPFANTYIESIPLVYPLVIKLALSIFTLTLSSTNYSAIGVKDNHLLRVHSWLFLILSLTRVDVVVVFNLYYGLNWSFSSQEQLTRNVLDFFKNNLFSPFNSLLITPWVVAL